MALRLAASITVLCSRLGFWGVRPSGRAHSGNVHPGQPARPALPPPPSTAWWMGALVWGRSLRWLMAWRSWQQGCLDRLWLCSGWPAGFRAGGDRICRASTSRCGADEFRLHAVRGHGAGCPPRAAVIRPFPRGRVPLKPATAAVSRAYRRLFGSSAAPWCEIHSLECGEDPARLASGSGHASARCDSVHLGRRSDRFSGADRRRQRRPVPGGRTLRGQERVRDHPWSLRQAQPPRASAGLAAPVIILSRVMRGARRAAAGSRPAAWRGPPRMGWRAGAVPACRHRIRIGDLDLRRSRAPWQHSLTVPDGDQEGLHRVAGDGSPASASCPCGQRHAGDSGRWCWSGGRPLVEEGRSRRHAAVRSVRLPTTRSLRSSWLVMTPRWPRRGCSSPVSRGERIHSERSGNLI